MKRRWQHLSVETSTDNSQNQAKTNFESEAKKAVELSQLLKNNRSHIKDMRTRFTVNHKSAHGPTCTVAMFNDERLQHIDVIEQILKLTE